MKKGQVSVFIIAGIAIVGIILMFLFFKIGVIQDTGQGKDIEPNSFLSSCLEDKIKETTEILSSQGGSIGNPLNKTFQFSDERAPSDISYLCYTQNYYETCVNQEPVLIGHLKKEIKDYISEDVKNCFDELVFSLEKKGHVVDAMYKGFDIKLMPKKIIVEGYSELVLTKSGETTKQEDFKVSVTSKFYDLAVVVQEITSQEARFCNFENLGFMLFYLQFDIDKFKTGDSTTIYTVGDRDSKEEFKFAIRGCVIPPGI
ncbi:hypothetical protein GOV13_01895 [Candidatus Pacearchaeota archaeon]|nr:hypothetical protein [Candidatus Pacearchaeota archaeon]